MTGRLGGNYPLYGIVLLVELSLGVVSPILPEIKAHFGLSALQTVMVVTAYAVARVATDLPMAMFLDRFNRTALMTAGSLLITAGSLGCFLAGTFGLLLAARFVTGIGTALCMVTVLAAVSRAAGAGSRGRSIAVLQAFMLVGVTMSPALGGVAASFGGWRAAFLLGALAGSLATVAVVVADRLERLRLLPGARATSGGARGGGQDARRAGMPWNLVAINFTTFVFSLSVAGFRNSMVPLFGGTTLGIGTGTLGMLLGGAAMIRFAVTLASGFASDRYGRKIILIPGTFVLAAGTLSFALAQDPTSFALCVAALSLGGFGNALPTIMVVDAVPASRIGFAIGLNRFVGDAGMLVGPVVLGWVLDEAGFSAAAAVTAAALLATVPGVAIAVREKRAPSRPASPGSARA